MSAVRAANTYNLDFSAGVSLRFAAALSAAGQVFSDIISTQVIADAIAELKNARAAGLAGPLGVGIAALLYPSELGNGELSGNYLLSTSLADLGVDVGSEAQAAALARGALDLPVRMASQSEGADRDAVVVAGTEGKAHTSAVRVLAATLDTETGNYSITTEDTPSRTLVWTPATTPESNSTTSPAIPLPATFYVGPALEPLQGRLDSFPELEDTGFDDYVVIFPSDSGLPPLYLMFRSRRHMPGVVVGMGEDMAGALLIENNRQGSNIPEQIAGKMRGQKFSSFGAFRSSFWMWVADTQELSVQFDRADLHMMRRGLAPLALPGERVGGRIKYEIHHKVRIADGGDVYDVSNMIILSPKFHIEAHR
ncbi:S-type pyocin domain-containing protein [Pseudomonas sp. S75]|uniref:S-type pyocin domain-containing protein n=1 Tax=unclassified Pseudomonas TaxID=196821 RepID=UPI001906280A|nr:MULTISPECIES: S-type pyocin domain-containing protein [unclassified Pseudomonas]MBJ9976128.1 S-type pyocin domain-containing protein [Pseudomonas sp. S30]MBK0155099.1 S-type pyocin domain-containing protein [Pseudomonas sp. S75]